MKKAYKNVGIVLAGALLFSGLSGFLVLNNYVEKIKYDQGTSPAAPYFAPVNPEYGDETGPNSQRAEIDTLDKRIRDNLLSDSTPLLYNNEVFNVLLIGLDTRQNSKSGNSDSMILVSINRKTARIVATSLLRDIYVNIPGYSQGQRLNAAFAIGGPRLLLKTIQQNFRIKVDKYISLNFFSFIKIINQVGGVSVDVSCAETEAANSSIREINSILGLPLKDGYLTTSGRQELNGKQALAYARIRSVGNADFGRTDRQRLVIKLAFDKIKRLDIVKLNGLLNTFLPEIITNLTRGELLTLILSIPKYSGYTLDSWYIPMDGTFSYLKIRGMEVLGVDFKSNLEEIQKKIYR